MFKPRAISSKESKTVRKEVESTSASNSTKRTRWGPPVVESTDAEVCSGIACTALIPEMQSLRSSRSESDLKRDRYYIEENSESVVTLRPGDAVVGEMTYEALVPSDSVTDVSQQRDAAAVTTETSDDVPDALLSKKRARESDTPPTLRGISGSNAAVKSRSLKFSINISSSSCSALDKMAELSTSDRDASASASTAASSSAATAAAAAAHDGEGDAIIAACSEGYLLPGAGDVLGGRYRVVRCIGRGMFSSVFACQDINAGGHAADVAVKVCCHCCSDYYICLYDENTLLTTIFCV